MTRPSVGVVIPTFDRPDQLRRALASIAAQTLPPREVHVVENGGRRAAQAIVEQAGGAARGIFHHWLPEPDGHAARNEGIRRCHTDYIAFLDDDDEWLPDKLARQVERLEADPSLGWIACRVWRIEPSGEAVIAESPFYRGVPSLAALVSEWCFVWTLSSVVVRRTCLTQVGPFSVAYHIAGDYDLYLRLARRFAFAVLDEPLVRYHQHTGNITRNRVRIWRELLAVLAKLEPAPEQGLTRGVIQSTITQYARWLYDMATRARWDGRPDEAVRLLSTALRYAPAIGLKVPWARFSNPLCRSVRPYAVLAIMCLDAARVRLHMRWSGTSRTARKVDRCPHAITRGASS